MHSPSTRMPSHNGFTLGGQLAETNLKVRSQRLATQSDNPLDVVCVPFLACPIVTVCTSVPGEDTGLK